MGFYLGIDIGGTSAKVAQSTPEGISEVRSFSTQGVTPQQLFQNIRAEYPQNYRSIGIGFPGILSPTGKVLGSPNLASWQDFSLQGYASELFQSQVLCTNDANLTLWASRPQNPSANIILLTLGTGVGGGILSQNQVLTGQNGFAAEIGHINVDPNGVLCGCGRKGCLETIFSSLGIQRLWGSSPKHFFEAVAEQNAKALELLEKLCDALAIGISNLCTVLDPELILFAGGLSQSFSLFEKPLQEALKTRLVYPGYSLPQLKACPDQQSTGVLGAIEMAKSFFK